MNYTITNGELYHYGVPGMKWGRRKARVETGSQTRQTPKVTWKDKLKNKAKKAAGSKTVREITNRGKSAIDVLLNGDKDWMGRSTSSDHLPTEARNRGKAAIERLLYSEKQVHNKKFFGEYNPFG